MSSEHGCQHSPQTGESAGHRGQAGSQQRWLQLTLWVYGLDVCLFWHSQIPDLVSVTTFQPVLLVLDNLIPRQDPNRKGERKLVGIARSLQLPISFFFLTVFLLKCMKHMCQFFPRLPRTSGTWFWRPA